MDGRSSAVRRARVGRGALLAVVATVGLVAVPGTAAAEVGVEPLVDCHVQHRDGSWTAVFGYDNRTGTTVTIPVGELNQITARGYDSPQPTTFEPGLHRGVFSVTVTGNAAGVMWHLDTTNLAVRRGSGPVCPSSTELPEEGNGTGPAIALLTAGLVGGVLVRRANRRARDLAAAARGGA